MSQHFKVNKYVDFKLNENQNLVNDVFQKLINNSDGLKEELLKLIKSSISNRSISELEQYFTDILYLGLNSGLILKLSSDEEIYQLYLIHQQEIDDIVKELKLYEKSPANLKLYSVQQYTIELISKAILHLVEEIKNEFE